MEYANEKLFSTKDFYISVYLITNGYRVLKIDKTDPRKVLFFFNDFKEREGLIRDFLYGKALVEPQGFITSIKALKQLLYTYD